jgi:hypothetical protein
LSYVDFYMEIPEPHTKPNKDPNQQSERFNETLSTTDDFLENIEQDSEIHDHIMPLAETGGLSDDDVKQLAEDSRNAASSQPMQPESDDHNLFSDSDKG